jgi:adenylate cyclase
MRSGDASYVSEILRMKGEVLLKLAAGSDPGAKPDGIQQAEDCFVQSIEIAKQQNARLWRLRAAVSLGELYTSTNRKEQVRNLVGPLYDEFTEGFDSWDLRRAKTLMDGAL